VAVTLVAAAGGGGRVQGSGEDLSFIVGCGGGKTCACWSCSRKGGARCAWRNLCEGRPEPGPGKPVAMNFQAVLFDLDGTLLDTLADLADAMTRFCGSGVLPNTRSSHTVISSERDGKPGALVLPARENEPATVAACVQAMLRQYGAHWPIKPAPTPAWMNSSMVCWPEAEADRAVQQAGRFHPGDGHAGF